MGLIVALSFVAFVIVPNILEAENRSHQKRTMADMRVIATAWEARATDLNSYSIGPPHQGIKEAHPTVEEMARTLAPKYVRQFPRKDGWGSDFQFTTIADGDGPAQGYIIRSLGSDRRADRIANLSGATTNFADDIVYSNGSFVRYPEASG